MNTYQTIAAFLLALMLPSAAHASYYDSETGLNYNGYRYNDPKTGRFIQSDPIGLAGASVGSANTYSYASSNPLSNIDPSGLATAVIIGNPTGLPPQGNPFGHVGISTTGRGTYSFGTGTPMGSSLTDYLSQQALYRSSTVYILDTTQQQENAIVAALQNYQTPLPDAGRYDPRAIYDNCASRTANALDAGGITPGLLQSLLLGTPRLPGDVQLIVQRYSPQVIRIPIGGQIPNQFQSFNPITY